MGPLPGMQWPRISPHQFPAVWIGNFQCQTRSAREQVGDRQRRGGLVIDNDIAIEPQVCMGATDGDRTETSRYVRARGAAESAHRNKRYKKVSRILHIATYFA